MFGPMRSNNVQLLFWSLIKTYPFYIKILYEIFLKQKYVIFKHIQSKFQYKFFRTKYNRRADTYFFKHNWRHRLNAKLTDIRNLLDTINKSCFKNLLWKFHFLESSPTIEENYEKQKNSTRWYFQVIVSEQWEIFGESERRKNLMLIIHLSYGTFLIRACPCTEFHGPLSML